jgi:hypothetical protein
VLGQRRSIGLSDAPSFDRYPFQIVVRCVARHNDRVTRLALTGLLSRHRLCHMLLPNTALVAQVLSHALTAFRSFRQPLDEIRISDRSGVDKQLSDWSVFDRAFAKAPQRGDEAARAIETRDRFATIDRRSDGLGIAPVAMGTSPTSVEIPTSAHRQSLSIESSGARKAELSGRGDNASKRAISNTSKKYPPIPCNTP